MKKSVSFFKGIIVDVKYLETSSVFSYAVKHFFKKKKNLRRLYGERQLMCPYFNHFSTSFFSIMSFLPSKRFLQNQPTNRVSRLVFVNLYTVHSENCPVLFKD